MYNGSHVQYLAKLNSLLGTFSPGDLARARIELLLGVIHLRTGRIFSAKSHLNSCIESCSFQNGRGEPAARELTLQAYAHFSRCLSHESSLVPSEIAECLRNADSHIQLLEDSEKRRAFQAEYDWRIAMWEHAANNSASRDYHFDRYKEYAESGASLDQLANRYGILALMDSVSNRPWEVINQNAQLAFDCCTQSL